MLQEFYFFYLNLLQDIFLKIFIDFLFYYYVNIYEIDNLKTFVVSFFFV